MIQKSLAPKDATVTESQMVYVPGQSIEREIDILIETAVGPFRIKIAIEAKDEKRRLDLTKFESILGKYLIEGGVKVDKIVIVTRSGFTKPVRIRAKCLGVELMTLSEAKEFKWDKFVRSDWNLQSEVVIENVRFLPPVEAQWEQSAIDEGLIECTHGKQYITLKQMVSKHFFKNVLKQKQHDFSKIDKEIQSKGGERKLAFSLSANHEHWLLYKGHSFPVRDITYDVIFRERTPSPFVKQEFTFSIHPHISQIVIIPAVHDFPAKRIYEEGRLICSCCGEDHGIVKEAAKRFVFEGLFKEYPEEVSRLRQAVHNSPNGIATLWVEMVLGKRQIHIENTVIDANVIKIGVQANHAVGQLTGTQYTLSSDSGEEKIVTHLSGKCGAMDVSMVMPNGLKSETITINLGKSE